MKVGYVRVSTAEQNPARQMELMKSLGVEKIYQEKRSGKNTSCRVFKDKGYSGKNTDRPQFNEMLSFLRDGDTLYVESFSRLSRSTRDLLSTVATLTEHGVNLVSDKENFDTSTPQGKFVLTVFAALSEFERESILERQREGIEIAKAEGKYKGRKPIPANEKFFTVAKAWADGKVALKDAIRESGMSSSTFFRKCKQYEISRRSS